MAGKADFNEGVRMFPEMIFEDFSWSFAEPMPDSVEELVRMAAEYNAEIADEPFETARLTAKSPFTCLDVEYDCWIDEGDEALEATVTLRIDGNGEFLTYADILFQLHRRAHEALVRDDHHFLEGMERDADVPETAVPLYRVLLGS